MQHLLRWFRFPRLLARGWLGVFDEFIEDAEIGTEGVLRGGAKVLDRLASFIAGVDRLIADVVDFDRAVGQPLQLLLDITLHLRRAEERLVLLQFADRVGISPLGFILLQERLDIEPAAAILAKVFEEIIERRCFLRSACRRENTGITFVRTDLPAGAGKSSS